MSTHSLFPLSEYQGHKMSAESALILTESTSRRRSAAATQLCVFVYYGAAKVFRLSMWFKTTQTRPEWRGKCVGNGCKFEVRIKQSQTYNHLTLRATRSLFNLAITFSELQTCRINIGELWTICFGLSVPPITDAFDPCVCLVLADTPDKNDNNVIRKKVKCTKKLL